MSSAEVRLRIRALERQKEEVTERLGRLLWRWFYGVQHPDATAPERAALRTTADLLSAKIERLKEVESESSLCESVVRARLEDIEENVEKAFAKLQIS